AGTPESGAPASGGVPESARPASGRPASRGELASGWPPSGPGPPSPPAGPNVGTEDRGVSGARISPVQPASVSATRSQGRDPRRTPRSKSKSPGAFEVNAPG